MKLKVAAALFASLSLFAGSALAHETGQAHDHKAEKNDGQAASAQKVNQGDNFGSAQTMKHSHDKKHPIHQTRMGNH